MEIGAHDGVTVDPIRQIDVPCMTLASLFGKYGKDIDLMQIDAEGYDIQILRQLAATDVRPRIVQFESSFFTKKERAEVMAMIDRMGFGQITISCDTIAYRG